MNLWYCLSYRPWPLWISGNAFWVVHSLNLSNYSEFDISILPMTICFCFFMTFLCTVMPWRSILITNSWNVWSNSSSRNSSASCSIYMTHLGHIISYDVVGPYPEKIQGMLKKNLFVWFYASQYAFDTLKRDMNEGFVLVLPKFEEYLMLKMGASSPWMGVILIQNGHSICHK